MMDVLTQVEQSVINFTDEELSLFREWFFEFDNQQWDKKLVTDIESGKLDEAASEDINQFLSGKATVM